MQPMPETRLPMHVPEMSSPMRHFFARVTAKEKFDHDQIKNFKFGDPFLVSDVGRLSDDSLEHILEECPTTDSHFRHLYSVESLGQSLPKASEYVRMELQALFDILSECDVEFFLLRQLGSYYKQNPADNDNED